MGLFNKHKQEAAVMQDTEMAAASSSSSTDPERPPLKSPASAPASADKDGHLPQPAAGATATTSSSDQHVLRSKSEPAGGANQRHQQQQQSHLPQKDTLTESQRATLQHMQMLSKVMDNCITVPLINKKIGLDAMIGLVPYAGDMAGATVGTYIITRALKYNMPKRLVVRMMINQAIDSCVGVIPFVGDLFDFGFKANSRNMKLLQEHLEHPKKATRADTCFLFLMFFLVVVVPVVLVVGTIAAIILGVLAALGKLTS